jgi:sec-independent protein translocase protein TatB
MFDLSLAELAMIAVVALLVLGPERLPGAARTVGALLRRAQRSWSGLRADIERELAADELKRQIGHTRDEIGIDSLRKEIGTTRDSIARDINPELPSPDTTSRPAPDDRP